MPVNTKDGPAQALEKKLESFLSKELNIGPKTRILLTVSGGIDSMVMLSLFIKSGYEVGVAHCNFWLRGADSDGDEKFIRNYCIEKKINFYTKKFSTSNYAARKKISIQMAARELRYNWFEELKGKYEYDCVATAHHEDDAIETMILNLVRGPGFMGLQGIPLKRGFIIRPLLFASKKEIHSYAEANNIIWRDDKSNLDLKYRRNFVRHRVLPQIEKKNPGLIKYLRLSLPRFRLAANLIEEYSKRLEKQFITNRRDEVIIKHELVFQDYGPLVLFEILKKYGFNYSQLKTILRGKFRSGKVFLSETHELLFNRKEFIVYPVNSNFDFKIMVWKGTSVASDSFGMFLFEKQKGNEFKRNNPDVAQLDFDRLQFPLEIRNWQEGDKFQPLGMKGKKKISDFMIDQKIPVNLKRRVKIMTSGADIVWIVGHRIDDRYKIRPDTKHTFTVKFVSHD